MTDPYKKYDGAHTPSSGDSSKDSSKEVAKEQAAGVANDAKDRGREVADTAQQRAGEVAGQAQQQAGQVAGDAQQAAKEVASEATAHAKDLFAQARSEAYSTAGTQQKNIASGLHALGAEFSAMVEGSRESDADSGTATQLTRMASDRINGAAEWLERREPADVLDEVTRYARRNPGTFLLAAGAIGFLAGRVTRALRDDAQDNDEPNQRSDNRSRQYSRSTNTSQSTAPSSYYPSEGQVEYRASGQQSYREPVQPAYHEGEQPMYRQDAETRSQLAGDSVSERLSNATDPQAPGNTYPTSGRGQ